MKGLINFGLLSVCLVGVYCDLIPKEKSDIKTKCIAESGVDVKILNEMDDKNKFIQDDKVGCFLACILKDQDGFENGAIKTTHPNFPQSPKAKECAKLRGKNDCETANKVMECFHNAKIFTKQHQ